jgi:hypothetical protein
LATVQRLTVSVRLLPLFIGRIELPLLDLERPDISLFRDAADRANWQSPVANAAPLKLPPIQHFVINAGRLVMVDQRRRLVLKGVMQSQETNVGAGASQKGAFRLQALGTINREPFTVRIDGGPLLNVHRDRPYPFDADLHAGQTHILAHGDLPKPFDFGLVDAALTVTGANLGDLDLLTGLATPDSPPYSLKGRLVRNGRRYSFTGLTGVVGHSDLDGRILVDNTTGRPHLSADLHSHDLNYQDMGSMVGAPVRHAGSSAAQNAAGARVAAAGRILPDAPLKIDRVRAIDADVRYTAESVTAPKNFPLRQVKVRLSLDHGVLILDPVSFVMPHGEVAGHVRIDARSAVPTSDIDIKVVNLRVEDVLKHGGQPPVDGGLEARALLHGSGDTIHKVASTADGQVTVVIPRGKIRAAFAELLGINVARGLGLLLTGDKSDTDIRCAVADFRAVHGVLQARTFLVDTDVVLSQGEGTIDLNRETLNLTLNGKPKQFRLFHLSAPISVTGQLGSPKFGVKPGKAPLQVAGAVALGAVLWPLAAVLPFVDAGLAHDANCVGLVSQAQQKGAPVKPSATTVASSNPAKPAAKMAAPASRR